MADYNSPFTGAQVDAGITLANSAQQPPSEGAFVDGDKTKLDGIEAGADVTDTTNVTAAGALMDSEVTNLAAVKAFDPTDYATAAQGALADSAVQPGDDADTLGSGDATDGYVLTADGVGGAAWEVASGGGGTPAGSSGQFQFNDGGVFAAADLWQATNVVEQRNSTNAQTFNLYNTYDNGGIDYERGFMKWNANVLEIGTEGAGTGSDARTVKLRSGGKFYSFSSVGMDYTNTASSNLYHAITGSNATLLFGVGSNFGFLGSLGADPVEFRTNNNPKLRLDTTGSVEITTGLTVATLPAAPVVGMMARVTDATAPAVGLTVTGGGAAAALCWYNGTNWTVLGV